MAPGDARRRPSDESDGVEVAIVSQLSDREERKRARELEREQRRQESEREQRREEAREQRRERERQREQQRRERDRQREQEAARESEREHEAASATDLESHEEGPPAAKRPRREGRGPARVAPQERRLVSKETQTDRIPPVLPPPPVMLPAAAAAPTLASEVLAVVSDLRVEARERRIIWRLLARVPEAQPVCDVKQGFHLWLLNRWVCVNSLTLKLFYVLLGL